MTEAKPNDRPLSMLDMFVSKRTRERLEGESEQCSESNNTFSHMVLSIIEPDQQGIFREG